MKSLSLAKLGSRSRFVMIGYGLLLLIWLSLEDSSSLSVALLGTGLATLITAFLLLNRFGGRSFSLQQAFWGTIFLGATIGALSALCTTLLMFFKSSWHGHVFFDYPPQMMLAMLSRTPAWAFAGLLIGLAVGIFVILQSRSISTKDESIATN
jgi:hypothetical protein